MKKLINIILLIVLDLMLFSITGRFINNENIQMIVLGALIVIMLGLLYVGLSIAVKSTKDWYSNILNNIDKLSEGCNGLNGNIISLTNSLELQHSEMSKLFESQLKDIGTSFNEAVENVKVKLIEALNENNGQLLCSLNDNIKELDQLIIKENIAMKNMVENIAANSVKSINEISGIVCEISNINKEMLQGADKLTENIDIMDKTIVNLVEKEEKLIVSIAEHNLEMNNILNEKLEKMNSEVEESYKKSINILEDLKSMTDSNIGNIGVLFDETLTQLKNTIVQENNNNNSMLNENIERNINNLNELIVKENSSLKDIAEVIAENNSKSIKEVGTMVSDISNVNREMLQGVEKLTGSIEDMDNTIVDLAKKEGEFILSVASHNLEMNKILNEKLENMNNEIIESNKMSISILEDLKSATDSNIGSLGILFDDTLTLFKNTIVDENSNNNLKLSKSIDKSIKDMNTKLIAENTKWKQTADEICEGNLTSVNEIKAIVNNMSKLHKELLKELDNNQKKMMELSEADIKLMRDMINE